MTEKQFVRALYEQLAPATSWPMFWFAYLVHKYSQVYR